MTSPKLPSRDNASRGRIVSVSAAPYDGYPFPRILESLASCGVTHVEPAFIVGYTEPFDESAFSAEQATQYARWLKDAGIACHAFSSHIDLGRPDALEVFRGRMDFARAIGARVINTNAAHRSNERRFFRNIAVLAAHAEQIGLWIGLENPGDGSDNLLNTASDGPPLLATIDHPRVGLNYDAGNTISHRPGTDCAADAIAALPYCVHTHVKDVRVDANGFFFTPLGEGQIDCARIVRAIAGTALDVSIEIPMRLHRGPDAKPNRNLYRVPLGDIEPVLETSLQFVQQGLAAPAAAA
jgi:sugar phosphate isomerase/epimerase